MRRTTQLRLAVLLGVWWGLLGTQPVRAQEDLTVGSGTVDLAGKGMYSWNVVAFDEVEGVTRVQLSNGPSVSTSLAVGDEVLLINTQGRGSSQTNNVGNHEIFGVTQVSSDRVTFERKKSLYYGDNGSDANVGTSTLHSVQLIRIPYFNNVTVSTGASLTAPAWDGDKGGVLILRAKGTIQVDGEVSMSGRGYKGISHSGGGIYRMTNGYQGESIGGTGGQSTGANLSGGGGGIGSQDGGCGGGGGMGARGGDGGADCGHGCHSGGTGGGTTGSGLTQLFFGGAGGEGGADEDGAWPGGGGYGGGVVVLLGKTFNLSAGTIRARGGNAGEPCSGCGGGGCGMGGGGGGAGGTIKLVTVSGASSIPTSRLEVNGGNYTVNTCNRCTGGAGGAGRTGVTEDSAANLPVVIDRDQDGIPNPFDNCPDTANADQADLDDDGLGDVCDDDADADGYPSSQDCEDLDPEINPGQVEVPYDGIDQDCSGADLTDVDGDGFDGGAGGEDCNDDHPGINPGEVEVPYDGIDQDCSGADLTDVDGDGFDGGAGGVDCDDGDPDIRPNATEACNEIDDDCDDAIDEDVQTAYYLDADDDGYGDGTTLTLACQPPGTDYLPIDGDCDDTSAAVNPAAEEICNEIDDNCDEVIDADAVDRLTFYRDADLDGYGDAEVTTLACAVPEGYVADATDCDDDSQAVHPDALEVCNEIDDDCDGSIDEEVKSRFLKDGDGDGFGDAEAVTLACTLPEGHVPDTGATEDRDCDDTASSIHPGAEEVCDTIDQDCDGAVDEEVQSSWYADTDEDGYGDPQAVTLACTRPEGTVADNTDCDDTSPAVHPEALELCGDTVDQDCNGYDLGCDKVDNDGDSYSEVQGDCDDGNPALHPDAEEVPYNGIDEDCQDGDLIDQDEDGYDGGAEGDDCDDEDPYIHPGAEELCDLEDNNCDGATDDVDQDGDGFVSSSCAGPDCDDSISTVNPDAAEVAEDGLDNDCDGEIDEADESPTPGEESPTPGEESPTPGDESPTPGDESPTPPGTNPPDDGGEGCSCASSTGATPDGAGLIPLAVAVAGLLIRRRRG